MKAAAAAAAAAATAGGSKLAAVVAGAVLDASLFEVLIVDQGALGLGAASGTHSPQCELAKSPDGAGADARVQDAPEAPAGRSTPPTATRDSSNRKRQRRL